MIIFVDCISCLPCFFIFSFWTQNNKMHSLLKHSFSFASTFARTWNIALFLIIRGTEGSFSIPSTYLKHFILCCTTNTFLFYYSLITTAALTSSTHFCLFEDSLEECLRVGGCWKWISCRQKPAKGKIFRLYFWFLYECKVGLLSRNNNIIRDNDLSLTRATGIPLKVNDITNYISTSIISEYLMNSL